MSGVSARTLRYYDEIGLLKPARVASSGYRIYGQMELNILQQILIYKELGFSLEDIKSIMYAQDYDEEQAFKNHLKDLRKKRDRLDVLIKNVEKSISAMKGETTMSDNEKFEGLKQSLIDENEEKYGEELRALYGDQAIDESNAKLKGITQEQYNEGERLRLELEETLVAAIATGEPEGELAQKACDLHKQWLCVFYPKYSKEYHIGLSEMYVADDRFKAYYEKLAPSCAEFLRDAILVYCK